MKRAVTIFFLSMLCTMGGAVATVGDSQAAAGAPAALVVHMKDSFFKPEMAAVNVGDMVSFVNDDEIGHTVTAADRSFDSKNLAAGKTWNYEFRAPGTYKYVCIYHSGWMLGQITVTQSR